MQFYTSDHSRSHHFGCYRQPRKIDNTLIPTDGIAVDWVNQKLYWTDADLQEVVVYDPSNGHRKRLFNTTVGSTISSPRAIVVDPMNR